MNRWTFESPDTLSLDDATVDTMEVRLVSGHVDVVATDGPAKIEILELEGEPIVVTAEGGRVTIGYEDLGEVFDLEALGDNLGDALHGLGDALRDVLQHGRTARGDWARRFPWMRNRRRAVVSVAVPRGSALQLNVVSASAVVAGLERTTRVRSVSGAVTLDSLAGAVEARTVSGDLEAQMLAATLAFETVSGDLTVAGATSDRIQGKTVSGELTADVSLDAGGTVALSSVSGDVTVRLPEHTGATVDVRTTSGQTTSGFDGVDRERKPGRNRMHGVVGDGRGTVEVRTVSGDVHLLRRRSPASATAATTGGPADRPPADTPPASGIPSDTPPAGGEGA